MGRDPGEDVTENGYNIIPGNQSAGSNPNYSITFIDGTLTIKPADCTVKEEKRQNILQGTGGFIKPVITGAKGEDFTEEVKYSYDTLNAVDYATLKNRLATLGLGTEGDIAYSFQPASANYNPCTGTIHFTIKDIEFKVK